MSLEDDFNTTMKTLGQLRDAFEHVNGKPDNAWSKAASNMADRLREWDTKFGLEYLQRHAEAYEEKISGEED